MDVLEEVSFNFLNFKDLFNVFGLIMFPYQNAM
jgi:hypothetical protein